MTQLLNGRNRKKKSWFLDICVVSSKTDFYCQEHYREKNGSFPHGVGMGAGQVRPVSIAECCFIQGNPLLHTAMPSGDKEASSLHLHLYSW